MGERLTRLLDSPANRAAYANSSAPLLVWESAPHQRTTSELLWVTNPKIRIDRPSNDPIVYRVEKASKQNAFGLGITLGRADISRTIGVPMSRIRIVATIVGGNFGGKNEITTEPVVALLSKKTGRPVKCTFTRPEEFMSSTTRHPLIMDYKTGVTKEGKILGRQIRLVLEGGAYCSWSETTLGKACILSAGPYKIDNLYAEAFVVYTNKTMTGAMRGFGAPQVCFAYESHMDDISKALKIDPLELRLMNCLKEGSLSPTGQTLHSVVVKDTLLQAANRFGWNANGAQA